MKRRKMVGLLDAQEETILSEVNRAFLSKEYKSVPIDFEPIGEGEILIGELNPFEKALFYTILVNNSKYEDLVEELPEGSEKQDELMRLNYRINTLTDLFWANLRLRVGDIAFGQMLEIREGFKIVLLPEEGEYSGRIEIILDGIFDASKCSNCSLFTVCRQIFEDSNSEPEISMASSCIGNKNNIIHENK